MLDQAAYLPAIASSENFPLIFNCVNLANEATT